MPPKTCTACSLCMNVCPLDAIHLERTPDGRLLPAKDKGRCNRCGLCKRMCPEAQPAGGAQEPAGAEAACSGRWSPTPDALLASLAPQVVAEGGCVYGAVWAGGQEAVFRKASRPGELSETSARLYAKAHPGYVYRAVKEELQAGRKVLFCGTPYQVNALNLFLKGRDAGNLLTMEILSPAEPAPSPASHAGKADISVREEAAGESGAALARGLTAKGHAALARLPRPAAPARQGRPDKRC